jgi:hypothetical protein
MALRTGEKGILIGLIVLVVGMMGWRFATLDKVSEDKGIPYYTTSSDKFMKQAGIIFRKHECRNCHTLWTIRSIMQSVPAPALDGIGSLKNEEWFYNYFSAEDPQTIIPSRLKPEFRMPSYAHIPEEERRILASYMASLKVEDWYLEETIKREQEKLTGKTYKP